jgi:hypothetical protein
MLTRRAIFLYSLLACAAPAFAGTASVEKLRGTVEKRLPGNARWHPVVSGDRIPEGAVVRTREKSSVELVTERGHRWLLKPNSSLVLSWIQADETQARLESGRVLSKVKHLKKLENYSLATPNAVCAVRGTEFETITGSKGTIVAVYKGLVGVSINGSRDEMMVGAGQMTSVQNGAIDMPRIIPQDSGSTSDSAVKREARREVGLDMDRNEVIAAAASEQRLADYREGKTLIDVNGNRVRLEEYIVRSRSDRFKLVVLNHRDERLDYFYFQGTFNKDLPTDLSVALRDISGKYGTTAPEYHLTEFERVQSNTQDNVIDTATGGHLVKVEVNDDGDYVLTDAADATNTRTVEAAELTIDGRYKLYNPLADTFAYVDPANRESQSKYSIYIADSDTFRDLAPGDTVWKTRFNAYTHSINGVEKISYAQSGAVNTLASRLDATWDIVGGTVNTVIEEDPVTLDATITNWYGDGTFERYRTSLIDDEGDLAPRSAFDGISTGATYKNELLKWNYEQQVTATEFSGRKIDLVVEPKIFINSGLIQ